MIYTDQAIARIRAYLEERKVAKSRLAVNAGVPEGCTRNLDSNEWNPHISTLRKLEAAIPVDFTHSPKTTKRKR